jgi:hypothetical protein
MKPLPHASGCGVLMVLAVLIAFSPLNSSAQKTPLPPPVTLEPAEGRRAATAIIAEMLAQKPAGTNAGRLRVRGRGPERTNDLAIVIFSSATHSTAIYRSRDIEGRPVELRILHSDNQPNQYLLSNSEADARKGGNKISGAEIMSPFAGSDFWVADLGLEFLHWPGQRVIKKEARKGKFCNVLESVNPQPGRGGYLRVVSWIINDDSHGILHADAYDSNDKLFKQFDPKKVEKVDGEWQLQSMEMRNLRTDSRTIIDFDLD